MRILPVNLIGPDKKTAKKRILLLVIFVAPETLWPCNANSTTYSDLGLKGNRECKFIHEPDQK